MVLTGDLLNGISRWMEDEYGDGLVYIQNDNGDYVVFGEQLDRIGFAYSNYNGLDEQWYADARNLRVWLEIDGRAVEEYTLDFGDEEGMLEWFTDYAVYDELIGEADNYIEEHKADYSTWYAVQTDAEDTDWGTGSRDLDTAIQMANNRDCLQIAVIDESGREPMCVNVLHKGIDF